jgi:hypothetical protein
MNSTFGDCHKLDRRRVDCLTRWSAEERLRSTTGIHSWRPAARPGEANVVGPPAGNVDKAAPVPGVTEQYRAQQPRAPLRVDEHALPHEASQGAP